MNPLVAENLTIGNLNALSSACYSMAKSKGFWDLPAEFESLSPEAKLVIEQLVKSQKMALITTETSEQVEAIRKPHEPSALTGYTAEEEEAADQLIRIFDYCGRYRLRIGEAVLAKMAKNAGRPHKHGKAF